jgi:hypothetical protein
MAADQKAQHRPKRFHFFLSRFSSTLLTQLHCDIFSRLRIIVQEGNGGGFLLLSLQVDGLARGDFPALGSLYPNMIN